MNEQITITKQCIKCQQDKTLDSFNINRKTKDGKSNECRECLNIRAQEYYIKNKKKIIKTVLRRRKLKSKEIKNSFKN